MSGIKVSVIVPVYNVEKYLEECVDSLISQTLKDIEILLIDDGSTDFSGNICDRYAQKYENVRVIHKENEGQGKARNIGLLHVQGKYVYYMDSDDLLDQQALQFLYDEAEKHQLDVILFSAECFSDETDIEFNPAEYKRTKYLNEIMPGEELFAKVFSINEYYCSIPMRFYNRKYLVDNKFEFPVDIIHEDELFGFFSLVQSQKAECINNCFYKRRFRKGSTMTGKKAYRSIMGYVYTWEKMAQYYKNTESKYRNIYWDFGQNFLKIIVKLYCELLEKSEKKLFKMTINEMKVLLADDSKKLDKSMRLFLASPIIYEQYKKIINIRR